tara:strand:- start:16773 stop:16973 length:201 start_codon:yes stop_codon:yes gene_type:complete
MKLQFTHLDCTYDESCMPANGEVNVHPEAIGDGVSIHGSGKVARDELPALITYLTSIYKAQMEDGS